MSNFSIKNGSWETLKQDAQFIREQVFVKEQNIPAEDEWDELDQSSLHFVVYENDDAIATARLLESNSIGRVAVLKSHRGLGIGKILMQEMIKQARLEQRAFLKLSSQVHAIQFYAGFGFAVEGEEYLDCGIPHIDMRVEF
jgi:predicted GNAT family N-acyltransferase